MRLGKGHRFVRGGSDTVARLVPYGEEDAMRGSVLTDRQKQQIYNAHCLGQKTEDIAQQFNIARSTTYKVIAQQRKLQESGGGEELSSKTKTIAGDRMNGRLMTTSDPTKFEGTCVVKGKCKSKTFSASGSRHAKAQWEKWCQELRDEQVFMDRIERKDEPPAPVQMPAARPEGPVEPVVDVTPAPVPEIVVRPWKEVAEVRKQRIEELERELDEAKTQRIEFAEGYQMELHNPAYLIWAKRPEPKCYGLFLTMDNALAEVDRLNEVAKFLGSDGAFEVEEVEWKVGQ